MARKTSFEQRETDVPSGFKVPTNTPWQRLVEWFKENFTSVVLPILAIVILGAGIYYYSTGPVTTTTDRLQADATNALPADESATATPPTADEPAFSPTAEPAPTIGLTGETIKETAGRGDGVTHLARRALKTFLTSQQDYTLTSEHKIYIEDYLKDRVGSRLLAVGETLEFSTDQIQDAIAKAQQLTPAQLKNLTKYVERVLVL